MKRARRPRRLVRPGSIRPWWRRFKRNGYRVDRCEECGHRFRWSRESRNSFGNRDGKVYHRPCIGYLTWRSKAEERLSVLALACDLTGVSDRDLTVVTELHAESVDDRIAASSRCFRVFRDLEKSQQTAEAAS